jgi:adenylate cyclase
MKKKKRFTTLLISSGVGLVIAALWWMGALQGLEYKALDSMFTLRKAIKPSHDIVIVAFDEDSFKNLGRWPWSRKLHGQVVERLVSAGAKAIVFDVLFPEPETEHPDADQYLADAVKKSGRVVFASYFQYDSDGNPVNFVLPIDVLRNAGIIGFANILPELDGICRKIPVFKVYKQQVIPSLALAGLSIFLDTPPDKIIAGRKVSLDKYYEMMINFAGGYESFKYYPFYKVLNGEIPSEAFAGKIVLLGGTASGLFDFKPIPYSPVFPGVEIHANTMSNMLLNNFIKPLPPAVTVLFIVIFVLLSGLVSGRLSPLKSGIATFCIFAGYFALVFLLFKSRDIYLEFVAPAVSLALSYFGILFYRFMTEEREKRRIKSTFGQYLNPRVMEKVLSDPSFLKLGGQKETLTVLFSDIRSFTTITESLPPEELVALLNEYLSKMVEVVFRWDGTLDKFIGDAVMAYWGAPVPQNDHPQRGVLCAIDMHKELKILQEKWRSEGKKVFEIGVGVNSGEMTVGNMGSTGKMDYTVIGDNVNLGARLESTTKEYHAKIIISDATYQAVKDIVDAKHIGSVKVKGKTKAVEIYAVLGKKGEEPVITADQIHKDEPEKKPEQPKPETVKPETPQKFDPEQRIDAFKKP